MTLKFREFAMFILTLAPLLAMWYAVNTLHTGWVRDRTRQQVRERISDKADILSTAINSRISLLYGLKSFVESDPSAPRLEQEFERIARSISGNADGIRAVQLVRDGRIAYLWPSEGNRHVLGHNLIDDQRLSVRRTVAEALSKGHVVLNGPIELIQGGQGIVGRLRIMDRDSSVWGLGAIVIDIPELLAEAGIDEAAGNLLYAIRSGEGEIFSGDPSIMDFRPEHKRVSLIGAEWTFLAAPRHGWGRAIDEESRLFRVASGVIAILLGVLIFVFVRNRFLLKKLVEHRTSELSGVNQELRDKISERVKISEDLAIALERAEESDRLKDTFIASMSHEIRTPLHVIIGYTELLGNDIDASADDKETYMMNIHHAGRRLMRTVEQLLQLSSLRAGTFHTNREALHLRDVVEPLVREFGAIASARGLRLEYSASDEALFAIVDKYCVEQAVTNLIDNAIKYTNEGFIRIETYANSDAMHIVVRDTGIGIGEEYIERMFKPFTQEVSGYARPYEGLGLGLALTHQYIDLSGGRIDIQSAKGKGTTVTLSFPKAEVQEAMPVQ